MYRLLLIISLSSLCLALADSSQGPQRRFAEDAVGPRIVGGTQSSNPYIVSIYSKPDIFLCAGVILSKRVIATSMRCVQSMKPSSLCVRSGSNTLGQGGTVSSVEKIKPHWSWESGSLDHDVAVLVLADKLDKNAEAIPLAITEVADGESVLISGWGAEKDGGPLSKNLRSVTVPIMERKDCEHSYQGKYNITGQMICGLSPDKGPCSGDLGGPVVRNKELVGIMSFELNCGKCNSPAVFTNIPAPIIKTFLIYMTEIYE